MNVIIKRGTYAVRAGLCIAGTSVSPANSTFICTERDLELQATSMRPLWVQSIQWQQPSMTGPDWPNKSTGALR